MYAFILSRLDYCNCVIAGLPKTTLAPLQPVLNAAARLILNLNRQDHVTAALQQLHWLPIELRVQYKLCVMMHSIHYHRCPSYLASLVSTVADQSTRPGLRSAQTARYSTPRSGSLGERAFSYSGLAAWNQLPCTTYQTLLLLENTLNRTFSLDFMNVNQTM